MEKTEVKDLADRESIVKKLTVKNFAIDLVKSYHFIDRLAERKLSFNHVIDAMEKASNQALKAWFKRNYAPIEGVVQWRNLNVVFAFYKNEQTKHIDFVIQSARVSNDFHVNYPSDVVIRVK